MFATLSIIFGICLVISQAIQKSIDDRNSQSQADTLAKKQEELISKHEILDSLINEANSRITTLSKYVTGGENKPILTYNYLADQPIYGTDGKVVGKYFKVKLFITNIGDTPITNVTVKFLDYLAKNITQNDNWNEGTFDDQITQIKSINLIRRESLEPFYEIKIPAHFGPEFYYNFVIGWNSDYYHVGITFTINKNKNAVELTNIAYLNRYKEPILDINNFIGYKVNSLNDYYYGAMLKR